VLDHLLLQEGDVVLHLLYHSGKVGVLILELLDPLVQPANLLQLALAALAGGQTVAHPLALQLDHLLGVHVDGCVGGVDDQSRGGGGGGERW